MDNKTIFALSTVYGKSGVAVIRISGKESLRSISLMTDIDLSEIKPRYAYFSKIYSADKNEIIDQAIVIYYKAPNSFNGEDIVEFQCHGSKAVISSVLDNLAKIDDFRLAEPGEFSKRGFYNGKMDLTQAEGLADLIDAETREQQKFAIKQMEGNLKNLYNSWREELLKVYAYLEAYIDFPDEDIPDSLYKDIMNTVFKLKNDISLHLDNNTIGERLRDGFNVVIVGRPNSGKSSLINAITKREAVIVSDIEGTTRDAIDLHFDLGGYPVVITDTAGLRDETTDSIEAKGIEIAKEKIIKSDLIIALFDAEKENRNIFDGILDISTNGRVIFVANKCDKLTEEQCSVLKNKKNIVISAKEKTGIDELLNKVLEFIKNNFTNSGALITRKRYKEALENTKNILDDFSLDKDIELSAEDIRLAAREIGKITGKVDIEEVLDKIFGSFCIGK